MAQPVKWFRSDMRGAPVRNGTPGSGIAQYMACLITGFGDTPMVSGNITNNKATFAFGAGLTFFRDAVVAITGATPASLNGEHIVRASTDNTITINTGEANGPITGTVTVKYAPIGGWTVPFTAPNIAVFKSTHPESIGHFYQVTDTNAQWMGVKGYEVMQGVNDGTGAYPLGMVSSQVGAQRWKSNAANTLSRFWLLFGDARGFYDFYRSMDANGTLEENWYQPWYVGDLILPPGVIDNYASIVQGHDNSSANHNSTYCPHYNTSAPTVPAGDYYTTLSRNINGDAFSLKRARTVFSSAGNTGWSGQFVIPFQGARRRLALASPRVFDDDRYHRGNLPGFYCSENIFSPALGSNLASWVWPFKNLEARDGSGEFLGRRLMSIACNDTSASSTMNAAPPVVFMDIHGPWR